MGKRGWALLMILSFAAAAAFAAPQQGPMGPRTRRPTINQRVERMTADLNLTREQAKQVRGLLETQSKEQEEWRKSNPAPTRAAVQAHREIMSRRMNDGLKKILTPEQFKKHEEMMRRGMRRGRQGPPQG